MLGQKILAGTAEISDHKRFRATYAEYQFHERNVLAAIREYQSRAKSKFAENANTMGYSGVDFSLSMREFNQRYANKTGTAEHDPATDACTFTLKNWGPARYSVFEFVDQDLCKISFAYRAPSWDEFGGAQGIAQRLKDRLGPTTQTQKVDGLTIGLWEFPEQKISIGVNEETAVVQIIHVQREAKRVARQARGRQVSRAKSAFSRCGVLANRWPDHENGDLPSIPRIPSFPGSPGYAASNGKVTVLPFCRLGAWVNSSRRKSGKWFRWPTRKRRWAQPTLHLWASWQLALQGGNDVEIAAGDGCVCAAGGFQPDGAVVGDAAGADRGAV